jgi:hypothetical protein
LIKTACLLFSVFLNTFFLFLSQLENQKLSDKDERCPVWGKAGFCEIKKEDMKILCPFSCKKFAGRHYTVKYAKPPKRRSPRPTPKPKPAKPTPRPTPPLTRDEKEDLKEALAEYAEEEETRLREREEQRKQKDEGEISPIQAPPVLRSKKPSPVPVPALQQDDLNIDVPSEYEGGTSPDKQHTRYFYHLCKTMTKKTSTHTVQGIHGSLKELENGTACIWIAPFISA